MSGRECSEKLRALLPGNVLFYVAAVESWNGTLSDIEPAGPNEYRVIVGGVVYESRRSLYDAYTQAERDYFAKVDAAAIAADESQLVAINDSQG